MAEHFDDWDDEDDDLPCGGPRVGIVVVGVTNIVVAAAALVGGVVMAMMGSGPALDIVMGHADLRGLDGGQVRNIAGTILSAAPVVLILFGVTAIPAGLGVFQRMAWGRGLSLVLAALAGVLAILSLVLPLPYGVVPFGAHALVVMLVLHDKDYSYQFQ